MAGHLNALGLPAHLDEQAELEEELEDITSRLKRTINRFDKEEEHDEEDDNLDLDERAAFQTRYETMTARMEAMAHERSALLSSLADWIESADAESVTESRPSPKSSPESEQVDKVMFDSVVTTRMGVQKLKQLNDNMVQQAVKGKDMEQMAKVEAQLQRKVVTKFKLMMDAKKRQVIGKTFGAHWKHASEEICELLTRIRKEGVSGIDELEGQLERASRSIQRQADEMQRLEQKLHEKDEELNKLSHTNEVMSNEVHLLTSEKERYRDQIMKYRKKMKQRREELMTTQEKQEAFSDDEEEELKRLITPTTPVATPYQPKQRRIYPKKRGRKITSTAKKTVTSTDSSSTPVLSSESTPLSAQERPPSPERAGGSEFDETWHLEEENYILKDKVLQLEKKVIEKEHKMLSLEHQVHELIESIKNSGPGLLNQLNDDLDQRGQSVQDIATAIKNVDLEASTTKRTKKDRDKNKAVKGSHKQTKRTVRVDDVESPSPRETPTPDTSPAPSSPSPAPQQVKTEVDFELIEQLRQDKDLLLQELKNAKTELRRAQWELLGLRQDASQRGVIASFPTNTPKMVEPSKPVEEASSDHGGRDTPSQSLIKQLIESHGRDEYDPSDNDNDSTAKALANIRAQDYLPPVPGTTKEPSGIIEYDDEFQAYADMIRAERGKFKQRLYTRAKMMGLVHVDGRKSVASSSPQPDEYEEYSVEDQGMQTDPTMDPLGAWSNVPTVQMEDKLNGSKKSRAKVVQDKTGPLPPREWTLFDPTALQDSSTKMLSLGDIFDKKSERKGIDSAADLINFVESEMSRLTQGIGGYTGYLNNIIEQEVSSVTNANASIRSKLSEVTLKRIDRMRDMMSQDKTGGQKGDENKSQDKEVPQIRRGKFEMIKPGKTSRYTTKRAFGSYFAGRRFMIQQGAIPEQLQTQQLKSPGQAYPWETYAREHIYKAEMEAAECREQDIRSDPKEQREMLKRQVDQIAQHAIGVLQGTTTFFKETLATHLDEYDTLQGAVQLKEELRAMPVTSRGTREHSMDKKQLDAPIPTESPALCRSASLGSFLEQTTGGSDHYDKHVGTVGPVGFGAATPLDDLFRPAQSQSLGSIQSSHRYLPPLLTYKEPEPRNRNQYKLPKATLPKKGMVTLAVSNLSKKVVPNSSKKATQHEQDKVYDPKKRHRPAPQTHRKLQSKQKDLLHKVVKEHDDDNIEDTTLQDLRNQALTLPVGFFGTLTQETDPSGAPYDNLSQERKQLIFNATEQLKEMMPHADKYTAAFTQ